MDMVTLSRRNRICVALLIVALALALVCGALLPTLGGGTVYAQESDATYAEFEEATAEATYGDVDASTLWYYGEGGLNLSAIKSAISAWNIDSNSALKTYLQDNPIVIACVDTGATLTHELFSDVILTDGSGNKISYNAYNATDTTNTSEGKLTDVTDADTAKHGTAMLGTMAMLIKELGLQNYVKLLPVKASKTSTVDGQTAQTFTLSAVKEALRYTTAQNVDVVNLSLGLLASKVDTTKDDTNWISSASFLSAINSASLSSVLVAAAGNSAMNSEINTFYPAAHNGIVSVMAYAKDGTRHSTSDYGFAYDVYAPGESIYSAKNVSGTKYAEGSGTSYAATFVSVSAALFKLRNTVENFADVSVEKLDATSIARVVTRHSTDTVVYDGYTQPKLNLNTLMTADFSSILSSYDEPKSISVTDTDARFSPVKNETDGTTYLTANVSVHDTAPINLTATLIPSNTDPALDKNIKWVLVDADGSERVIANGKTLSYTLQKTDTKSTLDIVPMSLRAEYGTFSVTYKVNYVFDAYNSGNVKIVATDGLHGGNAYMGEAVTFRVEGVDYFNLNGGIVWYINGTAYTTAYTDTFVYTPKEGGAYTVEAQYAGWSKKIYNSVSFDATLNAWLVSSLVVAGVLVLGFGIVVAVAIAKRKRIKQNEEYHRD